MSNQLCNYGNNTTKITIEDPRGIMDSVTLGHCQNWNVKEEQELAEEIDFDGITITPYKYGKNTISFTRFIRYNVDEERKILRILRCMKTDPMNITATFKRTSPDATENPVAKYSETWKNCYLSSNEREVKPGEADKQDVEIKSEGLLESTEGDHWEWWTDDDE